MFINKSIYLKTVNPFFPIIRVLTILFIACASCQQRSPILILMKYTNQYAKKQIHKNQKVGVSRTVRYKKLSYSFLYYISSLSSSQKQKYFQVPLAIYSCRTKKQIEQGQPCPLQPDSIFSSSNFPIQYAQYNPYWSSILIFTILLNILHSYFGFKIHLDYQSNTIGMIFNILVVQLTSYLRIQRSETFHQRMSISTNKY